MALSKSDYQSYLECKECFWLRRHRPGAVAWPPVSAQARTLLLEGQQVERLAADYLACRFAGSTILSQRTFSHADLLARADFVREAEDGRIDLIEVKASTEVKVTGARSHLVDAAFQLLVAEKSSQPIDRVYVLHLDSSYARAGELDVGTLFELADVTDEVRRRLPELAAAVEEAVAFLEMGTVGEGGCDCRFKGARGRCDAFAHLNPSVPQASAHYLPRISPSRLREMDGAFALEQVDANMLSVAQRRVRRAYLDGPLIDREAIAAFLGQLQFPIHFYDYETAAPAIPPADGYRPFQPLPVQVSLHRLSEEGSLEHFEWLADGHGQQDILLDRLASWVGEQGSLVSWHMSFENSCNRRLARMMPERAPFLEGMIERTVDLEDPFKADYVDWAFRGSTSIKKVLPVLCPDLVYDEAAVHDGAGAVEAWTRMISTEDPAQAAELRRQLLAYCRLDTEAMVRIYQELCRICRA